MHDMYIHTSGSYFIQWKPSIYNSDHHQGMKFGIYRGMSLSQVFNYNKFEIMHNISRFHKIENPLLQTVAEMVADICIHFIMKLTMPSRFFLCSLKTWERPGYKSNRNHSVVRYSPSHFSFLVITKALHCIGTTVIRSPHCWHICITPFTRPRQQGWRKNFLGGQPKNIRK